MCIRDSCKYFAPIGIAEQPYMSDTEDLRPEEWLGPSVNATCDSTCTCSPVTTERIILIIIAAAEAVIILLLVVAFVVYAKQGAL